MEENIIWNQALTRNKELAGDKIAIIDNKIMGINLDSLLLDSDSHAESRCIYFWICRQATERKDMAVLVWFSRRRCYQEVVYKYHRKQ